MATASGTQRVIAEIRRRIEMGELQPGDRIPTQRELAEKLKVSAGVAQRARESLITEGVLEGRGRQGTFVAGAGHRPITRMARQRFYRGNRSRGLAAYLAESAAVGRESTVDQLEIEAPGVAPSWVSKRLGLAEDEPVLIRSRRYLSDGLAMQTAVSYVPWSIAEGTQMVEPDTGSGGLYARLEDAGYELEQMAETVTARASTGDERKRLSLPTGVPVLVVDRVAYSAIGGVELCRQVMAAHRWELVYDWSVSDQ